MGIEDRPVTIVEAGSDDLDALVPLFDAYRVFYEQPSDLTRARAFLAERFALGESVIFIAKRDDAAVGFVQMYPSFSSVWTHRIWILNDLFVQKTARRTGVAHSLLEYVSDWAKAKDALGLALETGVENWAAKALYESLGWVIQDETDRYQLEL